MVFLSRKSMLAAAGTAFDNTSPTVTITSSESSPTTASPIPVTFTFSEAVTGFTVGDITVSNGTIGNFAGSDTTYTADLTPSSAAAVTVDVAAGVCVSAADGDSNSEATQFSITSSRTFYYVRKTGNDTTGNGSSATPWLTIDKAIQTVPIGGGHSIKVGAGTYSESRFNVFYLNKSYTNIVIVEPESGVLGDVIVQGGTSTTVSVNFENAGNIRFNKLAIARGSSTGMVVWILGTNSNISLVDCTITANVTTAGRGPVAIWNTTNGTTTSNVTMSGCTINAAGSAVSYSVYIFAAATSTTINGVTISNCTFPELATQNYVINVKAATTGPCTVTNVTVSNCTISSSTATPVIYIGEDALAQGNITNTTVSGCTISGPNHVLETAFGVNGAVISNSTITGSIYGLVIKECINVEISGCTVQGGSNSGIYFKAATTPNAHNNTITATQGVAFRLASNLVNAHKNLNWQFQNNIVNVSGTGKALTIGNDTDDAGGGICDYNTYQNNSGLGVVRNDAAVANLAELQAAWADYSVTTNDSHSTVV